MTLRAFLPTTGDALAAVTDLYDFVWPTAAALWNLRWQVAGYCSIRPNASEDELRARFVEGSQLTGANLRRACVEMTWDQQTERLASVVLSNLFAIYEGWAKRTVALLGLPASVGRALQSEGVSSRLGTLPTRSSLLDNTVCSVLRRKTRYDLARLDTWMVCYRYFKELRNTQLHNHAIADQVAKTAYDHFAAVATPTDLGVAQVPQHYPVTAGAPVRLSLRGVVGFGDIVLRILATLDAELGAQPTAEVVLDQRWVEKRPLDRLFKSDPAHRSRQISNLFARMGYPGISVTPAIESALRARGLAKWI